MKLGRKLDFRVIFTGVVLTIAAIYGIFRLANAFATNYEISATLNIPEIELEADVTELISNDGVLGTPDTIVGGFSLYENKTLLIGHSTTVFENLDEVELRDEIIYDGKTYRVVRIEILPKAEISMNKVLAGAEHDTIILMTCAGKLLDGGDATHRLMITAIAIE